MHERRLTKNPAAACPRTWPNHRPSWFRCARVAMGLLLALASGASTASATETMSGSRWKLFIDAPGVYALDFEVLADLVGTPIDPRRIRLSHRGESVPSWIDGDAERLGRTLFLATRKQLWPRHLISEAGLAVIVLDLDGPVAEDLPRVARPRPAPLSAPREALAMLEADMPLRPNDPNMLVERLLLSAAVADSHRLEDAAAELLRHPGLRASHLDRGVAGLDATANSVGGASAAGVNARAALVRARAALEQRP